MLRRLEEILSRPRAPLWLGVVAVLLCLPALPFGLQADDVAFAADFDRGAPPWGAFWNSEADMRSARSIGVLAWWSSPWLEIRFLRPLASLTHALDFWLWPGAPWLMRLFNAVLFGLSVALAALLYRRLAPAAVIGGLAALLFTLDDGHAVSAGWISGRNTVLALTFSLLALWLHARSREEQRPRLHVASTAAVLLALLSAEAGTWSLALLLSYALVYESGAAWQRLRSIAAPLCLGTLWAVSYVALGAGVRGSSLHRDLRSPVTSLAQGLMDLPVWLVDQFGPGTYLFPLLAPIQWVRITCLPFAALLLWLLLPSLKRSRQCRFFALAFVLCLMPLLLTFPNVRLLLGPSFGAMGWIACSISEGRISSQRRGRWGARVFVGLHVWLAGLLFVPTLRGALQPFAYGTAVLQQAIDTTDDVVLVASPNELLSMYTHASMEHDPDCAPPRSLQTLYAGASALEVKRIDARTLEVEPERGWGHVVFERFFCAPEAMPAAGASVETAAFTAHVLTTNAAGMPQRVQFVFPTPLESAGRQWLTWRGKRPVAWTPPAPGESVSLAPLAFPASLTP